MKRILNFKDFSINENVTKQEINEIPGVRKLPDDGYEIYARDFTEDSDDLPVGKILVIKDNQKSICLAYSDYRGRIKSELWIPKDKIKISRDENSSYVINLNSFKGFLSNEGNTAKLEDFISDYYDCVIDSDSNDSISGKIKDDIESIMDMFGINCEVSNINRLEGENEYEAELNNKMLVGIKKRSINDLVGEFSVYKEKSDYEPSLSIVSSDGKMNFKFHDSIMPDERMESTIAGATKDSYINYLMKRSLGIETHEDKERMYDHLVKSADSLNRDDLKSDNDAKKENAHSLLKSIKHMKNLVSDFMPDEKISGILPAYISN